MGGHFVGHRELDVRAKPSFLNFYEGFIYYMLDLCNETSVNVAFHDQGVIDKVHNRNAEFLELRLDNDTRVESNV